MSKIINVGRVTSYADAVAGGYQGTREEWEIVLANLGTTAAEVEANRQAVAEDKAAVERDVTTVEEYKDAAAQSAASSAQSADNAHTDALAATEAKEAAQTAQGIAVEAKEAAAASRTAAESARTEAETAKTAAAGSALAAQNAATTATTQAGAASDSATAAAESARTLTIDATLTQTGQAADAKAAGDAVADLKSAISADAYLGNLCYYGSISYGQVLSSGANGTTSASESSNTTDFIDVTNIKLIYGNATTGGRYWFYKADKTPIDENTRTGKLPSGQELIPNSGVHFVEVPSSAVYFRISFPNDAPNNLYISGTNMYESFLENKIHEEIDNTYKYKNTITDFNTATKIGLYGFGSLSTVQNRPENFGHVSGQLYVMEAPSYSYQYAVRSSDGSVWMRIYQKSDGTFRDWILITGIANHATACIIGASIEAGTTHEWANPSVAHIDASKAYLTVALQNNGVTVTNLSHGGMGFVRTSSSGGYTARGIVDDTDFTKFESIYICLGGNDWNHNQPLGLPTDNVGDLTVCGQLKYVIEKIYASSPTIKIFVKNIDRDNVTNTADVPYTRSELQDAMEEVCNLYGVEMITLGAIANRYNKVMIYPDGIHPTAAIMALMAKDTTGRITFK